MGSEKGWPEGYKELSRHKSEQASKGQATRNPMWNLDFVTKAMKGPDDISLLW